MYYVCDDILNVDLTVAWLLLISATVDSIKILALNRSVGTSEGVPRLSCLTWPEPTCATCIDAASDTRSPNRRCNTSFVIRHKRQPPVPDEAPIPEAADGETPKPPPGGEDRGVVRLRNIVIDTGKKFAESALKFFPEYGPCLRGGKAGGLVVVVAGMRVTGG